MGIGASQRLLNGWSMLSKNARVEQSSRNFFNNFNEERAPIVLLLRINKFARNLLGLVTALM